MSENDKLLNEVTTLLSQSLEGELSTEQFEYFKDLLRENPQARKYYYHLLAIHATLQETESILVLQDDYSEALNHQDVWDALSMDEKTAPAIEIAPEKQTKEIIHKIHHDKSPYRISRFSLVTFTLSTAAILLVALFLRFAPDASIEVATLSSSINAVFADGDSFQDDSRLSSGTDSLWLQRGAIEITFDYGAKVVIEGPAEFHLNSAENMTLHSGRLYAHVPARSKGFMVEMPNSRVIDLGTEFAVKVDFNGSSDLHMIKGKASLLPGSKGQTGQGQILTAGQARRVDSKGAVQSIALRETDFIRGFSAEQGVVWRGQDVDLADIVGGGNGFGTGQIEHEINPMTGRMGPWELLYDRSGNGQYLPVNESILIDGVFVPDGGQGAIQVTSSGDQWDGPDTSNLYKYNIGNSLRIPANLDDYKDYAGDRPKEDMLFSEAAEGKVPLRLLGLMGSDEPLNPSDTSLFIHANLGITYDLNKIRNLIPDSQITHFKSTFGIGEVTLASTRLDMWILVDGQPRFSRQNVGSSALMDIDIKLSDEDRFLSLVITDSEMNIGFDWGLFVNPRLQVE